MAVEPDRFPRGAVECRPGDHLVRAEPGALCRIYRVRDILAVERLMPSLVRPVRLRAEADLLDSKAPAYAGQVFLLVDLLVPAFGSVDEARAALEAGDVSVNTSSLLLAAEYFQAENTRVIRAPESTD